MSHRLDALRKQHTDIRDGIAAIEKKAVDGNRDLTDAEQKDVDALYLRAESLLPEIEAEGKRVGSIDAAAAVLNRIAPQQLQTRSEKREPSPEALNVGEWLSLHIRSAQGDQEAGELLTRAVAAQVSGDNVGILPVPIIGAITKLADSRRPVWNSFTSRPMPAAGKTFTRPRITQRVTVAEQAAELDEVASRKMIIVGDPVSKRTFAGGLELSEQDVDWTDPAALGLAIEDFVQVYGEVTELAACTALGVLAAAPTSAWTATNIGTIITSITTAIGTVYTDSKRIADTMWLSMDAALTLAGMSNATTNVSALTLIRQALSDAGMPLSIVVGPQLPASTRVVGSSSLVESYENIKGLVQAPDVSHLGTVMAYRGYAATYGLASGFIAMV